ncbi:MAG: hypothetical protein HY587_01085 [Candidatus Omnitrophica bacterium]|nr:hypothetical protein [Candidatus Omnitrophota bacterium]
MPRKGKKKSTGGTPENRPKVRRVWKINPKTRVKESDNVYDRTKQKAQDRKAIDEIIDFFGE